MSSPQKILADFDVLERLHRLPDSCALTTGEAAVFLRSSVTSLENMRRDGSGPLYMQAGTKGTRAVNQRCLYQKSDLLEWQRKNKVSSTMAAAVRKGQLFASVFDLAKDEAFWIDDLGRVAGMVECTPMDSVVERLGAMEIAWLPVVDAAAREWTNLSDHRSYAAGIEQVFKRDMQRIASGIDATDLGGEQRELRTGTGDRVTAKKDLKTRADNM